MSERPLGTTTLFCLVVANMVGAGIFTTTGFSLADLRNPWHVLAAWVVGGIIAIAGAVSYGALATRLKESGGEYLYLSRRLHPAAGFVAGWISMIAGFTGAIAFAALGFAAYLLGSGNDTLVTLVAVTAIVAGALAHGIRRTPGTLTLNLLVLVKFGLLAALIVMGLGRLSFEPAATATAADGGPGAGWGPFATSVMWISLSYSGFNAAVYVAGESRPRNVRRAMVLGCGAVTVVYLALNVVFLFGVPGDAIAGHEDVAARVAAQLGGNAWTAITRSVICVALLTSVSSMVMAGPRVYAKMADDGMLPAWFKADGDVPTRSIAFQAAAACVFVVFTDLTRLLDYLSFTLSLCAALAVASLFVGRDLRGAFPRPRPLVAGTAAFYVLSTLIIAGLSVRHRPFSFLAVLLTILSGLAVWRIRVALAPPGRLSPADVDER